MLRFDAQGLIPVVIQDESNGQVLMVASMNEEALRLTRETGYTHLFSRSRNRLWRKGEESGHVQEVRAIFVNCEENSLLLQVIQHGPGACHTGHRGCYYRRLLDDDSYEEVELPVFDPRQVYHLQDAGEPTAQQEGQEEIAPPDLSEQDRQTLASDLRKLFSAYIYLRDHDLSAESNTSRLLQEQSVEYLAGRLGDELQELADVQTGVHFHTGRHNDTVLEASQVGYWLMLLAAIHNIKYDEVQPDQALLNGYATHRQQTLEEAEECLNLLQNSERASIIQGLVLGFTSIGRTCASAGVSPLEPVEYDMAQMRRKGLV